MTTPTLEVPATGEGNKRTSLTKFIRRASRVLKSRPSTSAEVGTPSPAVESKTLSIPRGNPPKSKAARTATTDAANATPKTNTDRSFNTSTQYLKLREDKARALFAKYGMTLSAEEWISPSSGKTQWVEKKIVMRVHRQCHRCQTTFGREKLCNQCQHTRCKKCPRFPLKSSTPNQGGFTGYDVDYSIIVDPLHTTKSGMARMKSLTMQTKSGREAIRKQPTQRVRRTCHRCQQLFAGKATVCDGCQHQRCPRCPRDPPKSKKWANGYPGDTEQQFPLAERVRKPVRLRYRWECHTCQKPFLEHEKICQGCGHEKCDDCPRKPPKKVKKVPGEDTIQSVEEKMKTMSLGTREQENPVQDG